MDAAERRFVQAVWRHHQRAGRHDLPWRATTDPYRILVSEVMLQQTQVERVLPKYEAFLSAFPNVQALAKAPLGEVLRLWQGLGYNRRAKLLWGAAQAVVRDYGGVFPRSEAELKRLPGVGTYTAAAVAAFAYNKPVVLIETNVRTVFLHHFFSDAVGVSDAEILVLVTRTLPRRRSREWYAALMDYGTYLKRTVGNLNHRSRSYKKQSRFAGSDRQARGAIIKALTEASEGLTEVLLTRALQSFPQEQWLKQLKALCAEGMVAYKNRRYHLP